MGAGVPAADSRSSAGVLRAVLASTVIEGAEAPTADKIEEKIQRALTRDTDQ